MKIMLIHINLLKEEAKEKQKQKHCCYYNIDVI